MAALRPIDRQECPAGKRTGVERVRKSLTVVAEQADVDDQRREGQDRDEHEREQDDDLSAFALTAASVQQRSIPLFSVGGLGPGPGAAF